MKKLLVLVLSLVLVFSLSACKDNEIDTSGANVSVNFAMGNANRTLTYNKTEPLTLSDGTVVSKGDLKPVWQFISTTLGFEISDVTVQDQKSSDMFATEAAKGFVDAVIYGGSGSAENLMSYGTQGYFIDLKAEMEAGNLPNLAEYMEANPDVEASITAYDGGIYHIPYIAEVGNYARAFNLRAPWVEELLDGTPTYDTATTVTVEYDGYWIDGRGGVRTGSNGGSVTPMEGVTITKSTSENVIALQNAAATGGALDGATACSVLVTYIEDNYDYTNPSELFVGAKAAYDIDELAALLRCVKTNPTLLTDGDADSVVPYFVRQSKYREDLLRLAMYFGGNQVYGSDSYGAYMVFDEEGNVDLSYAQEGFYNSLVYLSEFYAEGLIHSDFYDETNKDNFRTALFGTDEADVPSFGFMTMDWIASTTADSLNTTLEVQTVLPPVSDINGSWQYYIENARVIKPDGWGIAASAGEVDRAAALKVIDYIFSDEGRIAQNYGLPSDIVEGETFSGSDGIEYPKYNDWVIDTANELSSGNISTFLRDWMGSHIPIGYPKEIGFEYQYTSERGNNGWALLQNSTTFHKTYAGDMGEAGDNSDFYRLVPPVFSLTELQQELLSDNTALNDEFYEILFSIIREGEGNTELSTPSDYAGYKKLFDDAGYETFVQVYNEAYDAMTGE